MDAPTNNLFKIIDNFVEQRIKRVNCDKTFRSIVIGQNADGTYNILWENKPFRVENALPVSLSAGQYVWVKMPCSNLKNMHICGICPTITK